MTKEEILAKSRKDNQNKDYAELEYRNIAHTAGTLASLILCLLLYVLKICLGFGQDYGIYAIILINSGVSGMYMYFKTKDKKHLPMGIMWSIIGLVAAVVSILQLFMTASAE